MKLLVKIIMTPEEYFDMNEFADSSRATKPKIYISPEEIIEVHRNVEKNIDELVNVKFSKIQGTKRIIGTLN